MKMFVVFLLLVLGFSPIKGGQKTQYDACGYYERYPMQFSFSIEVDSFDNQMKFVVEFDDLSYPAIHGAIIGKKVKFNQKNLLDLSACIVEKTNMNINDVHKFLSKGLELLHSYFFRTGQGGESELLLEDYDPVNVIGYKIEGSFDLQKQAWKTFAFSMEYNCDEGFVLITERCDQ